MAFGSFDGEEDNEHSGINFVEKSKIYATHMGWHHLMNILPM